MRDVCGLTHIANVRDYKACRRGNDNGWTQSRGNIKDGKREKERGKNRERFWTKPTESCVSLAVDLHRCNGSSAPTEQLSITCQTDV